MGRQGVIVLAFALVGCAPTMPVVIEPAAAKDTAMPATDEQPMAWHCSVAEGTQHSIENVIGGVRYNATLSWSEGASVACLALSRVDADVKTPLLSSLIPAGWSERYDEFSAPSLHGDLLQISDGLPWAVTDRLAQGEGGGGGDVSTLWRVGANEWLEVLTFSLETYSDINALTDRPCATGEAFFRLQNSELDVHPCFDGEPQPVQRWRFVDGRAEPLP